MRVNLHIYASPIAKDSRSFKQANSLINADLFDKIIILGVYRDDLEQKSILKKNIEIHRLKFGFYKKLPFLKSFFFYIQWYIKVYQYVKHENFEVIQCHSVYDLPIGVFLRLKKRCKLIYDAHELETERNGVYGLAKTSLKLIERSLIGYTDEVLVVSNSIMSWYNNNYKNISCHLIRNLPLNNNDPKDYYSEDYFHSKYDLNSESIIYLYVGTFIQNRGLDIILETFANESKDNHVVFIGYGHMENKITSYSDKYKNIHIHAPVETTKIVNLIKSADIGISLIENCCLSYYYCLPNKLFEYASSKIPVIASNFPDMKDLIESNNLGWTINPTRQDFEFLIEKLNKTVINKKKEELQKIKIDSWDIEEKKYINLYKSLLKF